MNNRIQTHDVLEKYLNDNISDHTDKITTYINNNVFIIDNQGNTLFHIIARYERPLVMNILLARIANEKNAREFINRINHRGDTALHIAIRTSNSAKMIRLFIESNADLNIFNEKSQQNSLSQHNRNTSSPAVTPLMLICKLPIDKQFKLIQRLNEPTKKDVLDSYRDYLIKNYAPSNPHFQAVRKLYYLCRGQQNLQELLLAHHEFNDAISSQNIITKKTKRLNGVPFYGFKTHIDGHEFVYNIDDLLNRMPFYAKNQPKLFRELNANMKQANNNIAKPHYRYLNEDRILINDLISDIDNYLIELRPRDVIKRGPHTTFWATLAACITIYIALETWLGYEAATKPDLQLEMKTNNQTLCEEKRHSSYDATTNTCSYSVANNYFLVSLLFGILVPIIILTLGLVCRPEGPKFIHNEIPHREWQPILNKLEGLLDTLKVLAQKKILLNEQIATLTHLGTNVQNLLKKRKMKNRDLQNILHDMRYDLNIIKEQMIATNASVTFFAKRGQLSQEPNNDTVIDIKKLRSSSRS